MELLARLYGSEERVEFPGAVYGDDALNEMYASFDVVVQPALRAWSETFCIANVEAMAVGRPVVSFGVGGVGEKSAARKTRATYLQKARQVDEAKFLQAARAVQVTLRATYLPSCSGKELMAPCQ